MKINGIILWALFAVLLYTSSSGAENWVKYEDDGLRDYYYDSDSINRSKENQDVVRYKKRIVYKSKEKAISMRDILMNNAAIKTDPYPLFKRSERYLELDCSQQTIQTIRLRYYDFDDKEIEDSPKDIPLIDMNAYDSKGLGELFKVEKMLCDQ